MIPKSKFGKLVWLAGGVFFLAVLVGTVLIVVAGLREDLGKADFGLVLGSKLETDWQPSARLKARLDRTVELFKAGYFPKVVVSGGVESGGRDEANVMSAYLGVHGVPVDRIIIDNGGGTTFASARDAREIARHFGFKSVLVVSQYFHLPRARLALERFSFTTVYSAYPRYFALRDFYSAPREAVAWVKYYFSEYAEGAAAAETGK